MLTKAGTKKLYGKFQKELKKRNFPLSGRISTDEFNVLNAGYHTNKLHAHSARGCFIEDSRGNRYIDTALGAGTHLLGYAHPVITSAVKDQVDNGTLYILPNRHTYEVAKSISTAVPHFKSFVFCNTGSEATMRAARIARAYTGKKKVAMFSGGWHGGVDLLLFDDSYRGNEKKPPLAFKSAGLPKELAELILILPYNNEKAFEIIKKQSKEIAMVIIEPVQGSNPREDMGDFLRKLREITEENNILLCFDEIISGFRITLGGCQSFYGIEADMATFGKTIGGGLPIGVVAGKKMIMDTVKGNKTHAPVFMGGTFSANPLSMNIARVLLNYLIKNEKTIYPQIDDNSREIRGAVNAFCVLNDLPVRMMGIGSMSRLIFTDKLVKSRRDRDKYELDGKLQNLFYLYLLLERNIHVNDNRIIFISTAHKSEQVKKIKEALFDALLYFKGILK